MACLAITQPIRDLAAKFVGETEESIRNAVGLWQEKNNIEDTDRIPSASELNKFLKEIRPKYDISFVESTGSYSQRTKENADWSDVTVSFAADFDTAGEKATKRYAGNKFVPVKLHFGTPGDNTEFVGAAEVDAQRILEVLKKSNLPTKDVKLNVAGNGIYSLLKTGERNLSQEELNNYITKVIKELQKLGVTISEIRSGGQTGADEAGIIAAKRLGIKASINAPKGFKFRDATGTDISDEAQFKARFL